MPMLRLMCLYGASPHSLIVEGNGTPMQGRDQFGTKTGQSECGIQPLKL
jgi:hypothetical protein